ncbi:MAG: HAD-IIB family hydrolase [Deltaproteobacteria bacterium]|nr:HAD-IIB family hydrolase [Deltaproteobacteria bacterium]
MSADNPGISREPISPFFLIFTDLDGTLLDHDTYGWEAAIPALEACRKKRVPVILASSKTRAEMDILRRRLSLSSPFISENGGAIFFPKEACMEPPPGSVSADDPAGSGKSTTGSPAGGAKGLWEVSIGVPYTRLVQAFREIRNELKWEMKGFSDMGIDEISCLTGLHKGAARWAAMREYDEPFIIQGEESANLALLHRAAEKRGLRITSGGRFYHLQGKNDKARGMELVTAWYKEHHEEILVIALGDSPNDFGMLERADIPVLIRSGRTFPDLAKRCSRLKITDHTGPEGWNAAVLSILSEN